MAVTRAALAQLYSSLTGLDYHVALGQLNAENSSHPTNPLGVRCGNSKGSGLEVGCDRSGFAVYRSSSDGIRGAAWLLLHGSHYGGVRQAIANGTPAQQRLAIIQSGWAGGGYHGGVGFSTAGISGSAPATVGPPPVTSRQPSARLANATAAANATSGGTYATKFLALLRKLHISTNPTHVITDQEARAIVAGFGSVFGGGARPMAGNFANRTVGDVANTLQASGEAIADPLPRIDLFGALFGWVPGTLANAAVLVVVLVLGYLGLRRIVG